MKRSLKNRLHIYQVVWVVFALAMVGAALGFWVLISPDNPLVSFYRSAMVGLDAKVVIGPYPVERDFQILKRHHVMTIVTLLDPRLPYEKILLDREKVLAAQYGMTVHHFPMTSVFGKRFREQVYQDHAEQAADFITKSPGKVYLHCYLGIHRAKEVGRLVQQRNVVTMPYMVRQGERGAKLRILDQAQIDYDHGRYAEAVASLKQLDQLNFSARMLLGWALYHAGDNKEAYEVFSKIVAEYPGHKEAMTGGAYAAIRVNRFPDAETWFHALLKDHPQNGDALYGMGLIRIRQQRHEEARPYLEAVIKENPKNGEARKFLASLPPPPAPVTAPTSKKSPRSSKKSSLKK